MVRGCSTIASKPKACDLDNVERERTAVYMDGLAQMRSDWTRLRNVKSKKAKPRTSQKSD